MYKSSVKSVCSLFILIVLLIVFLLLSLIYMGTGFRTDSYYENNNLNNEETNNIQSKLDSTKFNILASEEMKDLEDVILSYAKTNNIDVHIDYAGTLEIMNILNTKEKYDAIWASNSIWTYMIDSNNVSLKNSKSTSITPVVFGIKKSKAEELGFVGKDVYTQDILDAVSSGKLKFAMSNPVSTNSGASAFLGMLYTFAGNPEVLTEEILQSEEIRAKMKSFFLGLERTSGSEDFLEELFLQGDYEAVFTYEFSIININNELIARNKEPLYAIYPIDGVSISDNPFVYVDHKDANKEEIFNVLQSYLISKSGQKVLENHGRRTWYGGVKQDVDKSIFNPDWGIDTTKYITPVKYPSSDVIRKALVIYQTQFRKPIHVVFCLDYSGSMYGSGIKELRDAMKYILTDQATKDYIQFSDQDEITILTFSSRVEEIVYTPNGEQTEELLELINTKEPYGSTAIYDAAEQGLELLKDEYDTDRNLSIILMTDGVSNVGSYSNLERYYKNLGKDIPIYAIMFGEAKSEELSKITRLTNGKVFDGKTDLVKAFKEVRGYN